MSADSVLSFKESAYNCSKKCKRGHELKKQDGRCCYQCVLCLEGDISLGDRKYCINNLKQHNDVCT